MDPVQLRPATPDDVDAVVALVESAYRGESGRQGWTTESDLLDGRRTGPDEVTEVLPHLLVADDLTACCVLEPRGDHGYFGMFAVSPALQGGGIGSQLLAAAEQRARELGLRHVEMTVLSVRSELIAFYERRGYVRTGQSKPFPYGDERFGVPKRDDLEFVVLVKELSAS